MYLQTLKLNSKAAILEHTKQNISYKGCKYNLDSHQNHVAYIEVRSKEPCIWVNIPVFQSLQQLSRMYELSQSTEDFLQGFLELLLVYAAKCLRSK
jgi:hypothetical protein